MRPRVLRARLVVGPCHAPDSCPQRLVRRGWSSCGLPATAFPTWMRFSLHEMGCCLGPRNCLFDADLQYAFQKLLRARTIIIITIIITIIIIHAPEIFR